MGKKIDKKYVKKSENLHISKGIRLLFWATFAGMLIFIPARIDEFATVFVPSHILEKVVTLSSPFIALCGFVFLRNVNKYLFVAFILQTFHLIYVVLRASGVFRTSYIDVFVAQLVASALIFCTLWGLSKIFKNNFPKLSKKFRLLLGLNILSAVVVALVLPSAIGAENAGIVLVLLLFMLAVYELYLLRLAYKYMNEHSCPI